MNRSDIIGTQSLRRWLIAIIVFAAALRYFGLGFDSGYFFHPDERRIAFAVEELSFQPLQLNPHFFAYGSFPLYVVRAVTSLLGLADSHWTEFANIVYTGRAVSASVGILTVLLLIQFGRRLYSDKVGLLAGFLLSAAVLHLQNSHFMTTDVSLSFLVTLALYCCINVVERGRTRDYLASGIVIGLAVATKFSALPLLAPLAVAGLLRLPEERLLPIAARGTLALFAAVIAFSLGEPYALLDYANFSKDILEQSHMVRNAGSLPYTNQYIGVPKYGYDLTQLLLWGMGPPLGLAALWGTGERLLATIRARPQAELVLFAWAIPFFLITGSFDVKFVRYLLPLYPLLCLWAAAGLWRLAEYARWGRWLLWGVVLSTGLYAVAYASIYSRPHSVVTASDWVYRHVPAGQTLLTQHWDEGFPLDLPSGNRQSYKVIDLPYYEADTPQKWQAISQQLATADYVAFQTKRLYGALTMAQEKYPLSNNYFHLLFSGDLGYTLVYDYGSRPGLFGWEVPDELADESFSVYDHPKVVIFRNTKKLPADQIYQAVLQGIPSHSLSRNDILLARTGDTVGASTADTGLIRSSTLALLSYALVVQILGLSAYAWLRRWVPLPGAYALAKVIGVILFAYIPWLLTSSGITELSRATLGMTVLGLVGAGLVLHKPQTELRNHAATLWPVEFLFWGTFLFFAGVRAFNPEIYWGEKPMDFSFLNMLMRTTSLPPPEPWFSGSSLHYSYFGHYVVAMLGKLCHIHPGLAFNLGIALFGALTAVAGYGLGCSISARPRVGLITAALVLGANLSGVREWIARHAFNFDYFWATARVIPDTINEYPLWSYLFADLHAHVLVLPFSLSYLAFVIGWVRCAEYPVAANRFGLLLLMGLTLGSIMVTNGWSTPTYVIFLLFLLGGMQWARGGSIRQWLGVIATSVAVVILAYVFYLPFWLDFAAPPRRLGLEAGPYANAWDFSNIFGLFLFIGLPYLFVVYRSRLRAVLSATRRRLLTLLLLLLTLTIVGSLVAAWPNAHLPLSLDGSLRIGLGTLAVLAFCAALLAKLSSEQRTALFMLAYAFAIIAGTEIVYVWDRMNTVFKFYLEAWLMLSGACAVILPELWRGSNRGSLPRSAWKTGLLSLVGVSLFTTAGIVWAVMHTRRVPGPTYTLDGIGYLQQHAPHDAAAFAWINEHISGIPVIAEAFGPPYQEYTRVSMNTGLPTVLGWDYHVQQRAQPIAAIEQRKHDLKALYTSDQPALVSALLRKYHVALVYVGPLERRTYAGANLENFKRWQDVLQPLYSNAGVTLFAVRGQFTATVPVTTIETVPQPGEQVEAYGEPGQLLQPRGLSLDPAGNAYVADFGYHRVQAFDTHLRFRKLWGSKGDLPGQFKEPGDIAIAADGSVYVADTWNHRVQVFDHEGKFLREWSNQYFGPRGITVGPDGNVYLADTGHHRILKLSPTGQELTSWGIAGHEPGQFQDPVGIAVDNKGQVYVADNGNARVQIFSTNGQYLGGFPVPGLAQQAFSEPHVALGKNGVIWITVPVQRAIRAYTFDGKLVQEIKGDASSGVPFQQAFGLAYDRKAHELIISDISNRLLRIAVP